MIIRYSMIEAYLQCPRKFQNLYLLGKAQPQNSSALHFGTAMHTALKAVFDGEDEYANFDMYWDSVVGMHLEYDRYTHEDLRSMARDRFLPNFRRLHFKHFGQVITEETISVPFLGEHTLQGTFDLCGEHDGELTMVDWKTAGSAYNVSKLYRNPQLYIYSYLYQQKYGVLPKNIMYKIFVKSTKMVQTLKIPLSQTHIDVMMNNITAIVEDIVKRKTWFCNGSCFCLWPKECFPTEEHNGKEIKPA